MKKFVCELCESTNLLKEDGQYVCQGCGARYSVEEAKKLLVEVGDDNASSSGSAPTAGGESQKVANLRKLAMRAKEDGDSDMAARYFEQLMMECPDDWEARFYSTFYAAHNIKIAQIGSAASKVSSIIGPTLQMIKNSYDNDVEIATAYMNMTTDVINFSSMLFNNITPNLGSSVESVNRNIDNWAVPTVSMLVTMGDELQLKFPGEETDDLAGKLYDLAFNYTQHMCTNTMSARRLHNNVVSRQKMVEDSIKARKRAKMEEELRKKEEKKKKRYEEYWAAHAEERKALEQEMKELKDKVAELEAQVKAIDTKNEPEISRLEKEKSDILPAEQDVKNQEKVIAQLQEERRSLGLFKGKQKKAIDARISEIEMPKLAELKSVAEKKRSEYLSKIKRQIAALIDESKDQRDQIMQLEDRIANINNELTKAR